MFESVNREQVRRLIGGGAQVLEVLESRQYRLAHLPGAVSIPAWQLNRERAGELDPSRPVVVYCFDTLWDLSPRAACLLDLYGFSEVYDYVDGKVDWMAYGLPVEGGDGPFLGSRLAEVTTCDVTARVADARRALDASGADTVVLVHAGGMAVGEVDRASLEGMAGDVDLLDILDPVPTTVRPSVTVASLADAGGGERLVTTSDGRLLGRAAVAADHGHDHAHDHDDDAGIDQERFEAEMAEVMKAVEERFGDEDPSARELRGFLHERLVAEGRTAEEADQFIDQLEIDEDE